ncbi:hypothetical protein mRhiFer1_008113 [Rhinolophus ferrumequinum]|uniref:Uncharacterized protein n=1 Tax=Rhinolophus ferrumequinum TaxID=59479 RepID=A0A7J7W7R0_RHIFE|nr:hypothetical protein mRhiFer1_008113 [Rhinolophus ferrumequinum]
MSRDRRPHVELSIHRSPSNVRRVLALVDTGADCSLVDGNPELFPGPAICIDGYAGKTVTVKAVSLPLGIGRLPPRTYKVYVSPVAENIHSRGGRATWPQLTDIGRRVPSLDPGGESGDTGACSPPSSSVATALERGYSATVPPARRAGGDWWYPKRSRKSGCAQEDCRCPEKPWLCPGYCIHLQAPRTGTLGEDACGVDCEARSCRGGVWGQSPREQFPGSRPQRRGAGSGSRWPSAVAGWPSAVTMEPLATNITAVASEESRGESVGWQQSGQQVARLVNSASGETLVV